MMLRQSTSIGRRRHGVRGAQAQPEQRRPVARRPARRPPRRHPICWPDDRARRPARRYDRLQDARWTASRRGPADADALAGAAHADAARADRRRQTDHRIATDRPRAISRSAPPLTPQPLGVPAARRRRRWRSGGAARLRRRSTQIKCHAFDPATPPAIGRAETIGTRRSLQTCGAAAGAPVPNFSTRQPLPRRWSAADLTHGDSRYWQVTVTLDLQHAHPVDTAGRVHPHDRAAGRRRRTDLGPLDDRAGRADHHRA